MRWLLVALLLAPVALAQESPVELVTLEVDPFRDPVRPLQGPVTTTLRARVSCALADGVQGIPLRYEVVDAPGWATPLVSPSEARLDTQTCDQGWIESSAQLIVTASDRAPAFVSTPLTIQATAGASGREQSAAATVNLSATYFSILDVTIDQSIVTIPPGGAHEFIVALTNLGNGETRVEPRLKSAGGELEVEMPRAAILGSRQQGDDRLSEQMRFRVTAPEEDGFVNRVETIDVQLVSAYAKDDSFAGDESSVSFLVTVRNGAGARDAVPAPAALALCALILVAMLRVSLRR